MMTSASRPRSMSARHAAACLLAAGLIVALGGCDRVFVTTEATYPQVDIACVDRAVRGAAGVTGVSHGHKAEATGGERAVSHIWTFRSDQPAHVVFTFAANSWTFASSAMKWGAPWTSTDLESVSPVMAAIHGAIERQCGLKIPRETEVLWD